MDYNPLDNPSVNLKKLLVEQNDAGTESAKYNGAEPFEVLAAKTIVNSNQNADASVTGVAGTTGQVLIDGATASKSGAVTLSLPATVIPTASTTDGGLVFGSSTKLTSYSGGGQTPRAQIHGTTGAGTAGIAFSYWANNTSGPAVFFTSSRGTTPGSYTIAQNGDSMGGIFFEASDGTDFARAATISAIVDGTPGANQMPGRLVFSTANSAGTVGEAARIDSTRVLNVCSAVATPANGSTSARLLFGTTAGFGIYYGSSNPTVSAAQGSLYLRSDGSSGATRAYINTNGTTGWTPITTST